VAGGGSETEGSSPTLGENGAARHRAVHSCLSSDLFVVACASCLRARACRPKCEVRIIRSSLVVCIRFSSPDHPRVSSRLRECVRACVHACVRQCALPSAVRREIRGAGIRGCRVAFRIVAFRIAARFVSSSCSVAIERDKERPRDRKGEDESHTALHTAATCRAFRPRGRMRAAVVDDRILSQ